MDMPALQYGLFESGSRGFSTSGVGRDVAGSNPACPPFLRNSALGRISTWPTCGFCVHRLRTAFAARV